LANRRPNSAAVRFGFRVDRPNHAAEPGIVAPGRFGTGQLHESLCLGRQFGGKDHPP